MSAQMIVELPDGKQVLFGGTGTGLVEAGLADDIARATNVAFKSALAALGDVVKTMEESIGSMPKRPDKLEVEFGATITADCKLWIVSGKGDYTFKVKLAWDKFR